jgi:phosphopantetheine--protein transferase-like protein
MVLIGVGLDVLEVARVARLLDRYQDRFVERWFTSTEISWCREQPSRAAAFAAVLAAKEAVWKSLRADGSGPVPWRSLEALPVGDAGRVRLPPALSVGVAGVGVCVEHRAGYVVACAVAWAGREDVMSVDRAAASRMRKPRPSPAALTS